MAQLDLAGAYVATEVPVSRPGDTVDETIEAMRNRSYETAVDVAVCDGDRLLGLVTIERLLAAPGHATLASVMDDTPPIVAPGLDQERAAWRMVQQNESSLAVVDDDGRFVGLVPPFRMLGVLLHEHAEDLARLGGFLHDTETARTATAEPVGRRLRHRLPWILLGLAGAMLSTLLVGSFERDLERDLVLAYFVPAVVYIADAVGTQTEALVIRGLSIGVRIRSVVRREVLTGLLIGVAVAGAFFVFAIAGWGDADVAVTVALALLVSCSIATVVALALPITFERLGLDPAFGSGPLATVLQDLLSLLVYFAIATAVIR